MQHIDYSKLKLDTIKDGKSQQERAQEQLAAERKPDQDAVDAVTYGLDRSNFSRGGSDSSDDKKKRNPLDTHSYVTNGEEMDAKVKATPPKEEPKPAPVKPAPQKNSIPKGQSKFYDEDVEDFEKGFDGSSDIEDVIEEDGDTDGYIPPKMIEAEPEDDVPDDDIGDEGSGYDDDEGDSEEDYEAELRAREEAERKRREAEAKLRARTQAANQKNKPKAKTSKAKEVTEDEVQYSYLRKVPKELVQKIKAQFPLADTMDEAVSAYLYLKEGKPKDVIIPDRIKEVASHYLGTDVTPKDAQDEIIKAVTQLSFQLRSLTKKSNAIELAAAYMLFDYMGFRRKEQTSPSEIDFLEKGMNELISTIEKSSEYKAMKDRNRAGSLTTINKD